MTTDILLDIDSPDGSDDLVDIDLPGDSGGGIDLSMEDRTAAGSGPKISATVITPSRVTPEQLGPSTEFEVLEPEPSIPGAGSGMTTEVSGGTLESLSGIWQEHKNKIMIGGAALLALLLLRRR